MRIHIRISKELETRIDDLSYRTALARGHHYPIPRVDLVRLALSKGLAALEAENSQVIGEAQDVRTV